MARHEDGDPSLGQPLCWECYDYASNVVWQWWAPELWRRFAISLKRLLAERVWIREARLRDFSGPEECVAGFGGCQEAAWVRVTAHSWRKMTGTVSTPAGPPPA